MPILKTCVPCTVYGNERIKNTYKTVRVYLSYGYTTTTTTTIIIPPPPPPPAARRITTCVQERACLEITRILLSINRVRPRGV